MKRLILSVLLLASVVLLGERSASAVSIDFVPSVAAVNAGDVFSVDVVATGLGAAPADIVSAFDILVSFDPGIVTPTGFSFTNNLGDPALFEADNSATFGSNPFATPGFADLFALSYLFDGDLLTLQSALLSYPDVPLATIDFTANVGIPNGSNPNLAFVWDAFHDVKGSNNTPITVPEPGTILLIGAGMAGLGLSRRRKAKAANI
jgi:hypothetical protein